MLNWIDDSSFEMDGYRLTLDYAFGGSLRPSTAKDFTMMKSRDFLDSYVALRDQGMKRILEVGVYQGGSFVFLDRLLKPEKISAVELSTKPIPALDEYIVRNKDRARLHYGTSQDDVARLTEIVQQDFGGELDLVVDDASQYVAIAGQHIEAWMDDPDAYRAASQKAVVQAHVLNEHGQRQLKQFAKDIMESKPVTSLESGCERRQLC